MRFALSLGIDEAFENEIRGKDQIRALSKIVPHIALAPLPLTVVGKTSSKWWNVFVQVEAAALYSFRARCANLILYQELLLEWGWWSVAVRLQLALICK